MDRVQLIKEMLQQYEEGAITFMEFVWKVMDSVTDEDLSVWADYDVGDWSPRWPFGCSCTLWSKVKEIFR